MTIVQHIQELRYRLMLAFAGIAVGTVLGFIWYQASFKIGPVPIPFTSSSVGPMSFMSLGEILKDPYCALPPEMRLGGETGECRLLATSPFEMFLLRMKVGALAGLVLSSPWWLYQIWAFVTPGLVRKEKRTTLAVAFVAGVLFVLGAVLAYVVVAVGLQFLMQIGDSAQISALTGSEYFGFILALIIIFGVSFELPLFVVMLNMAGVVSYEMIKDKRRIIILLLFIFSAFMTPGQEPYSMVAMAVALTLLMELAIQFCRLNDRRRKRERPDWLDVDDEQGSGPISAPGAIGEYGGIDAPGSIQAPSSIGVSPSGSVQASAAPVASPAPVASARPQTRPTRNSRPPRPMPEAPTPTTDFRSRPVSDFDDVL